MIYQRGKLSWYSMNRMNPAIYARPKSVEIKPVINAP
jgi:hypothetical protein